MSKNPTTNDLHYWLHLKNKVLHPITATVLTNKSVVVLIKNPQSAMSETETGPSQNEVNIELLHSVSLKYLHNVLGIEIV